MNHNESTLSEEYINENFIKVAVNNDDWTVLYFSSKKNMYVKKYFPFPEAQGCGPARFVEIDKATAIREFHIT